MNYVGRVRMVRRSIVSLCADHVWQPTLILHPCFEYSFGFPALISRTGTNSNNENLCSVRLAYSNGANHIITRQLFLEHWVEVCNYFGVANYTIQNN